jgi:hypothetical protein
MSYLAETIWRGIAISMLNKKNLSSREFKKIFKLTCQNVDFLWKKMRQNFPDAKHEHLLYTLHFLKTTNNNGRDVATLFGTTEKNLLHHVQVTLNQLNEILPKVKLF